MPIHFTIISIWDKPSGPLIKLFRCPKMTALLGRDGGAGVVADPNAQV